MSRSLHCLGRLALGIATLGLVGTCTWTLCRWPLNEALLEYRDWQAWRYIQEHEDERGAELDQYCKREKERLQAKTQICRELIGGRLTLLQAAQRVADLPYPPHILMRELRISEGGATDEECWCRHVIDWACATLEEGPEPERAVALRCRLEAELQTYLCQR